MGPVWEGGGQGERALLSACYRNALALALESRCQTVAFPLISTGAYGYPKAQALQVAVETITGFLLEHEMTVYIVVFTRDAFEAGGKLFEHVQAYIDDVYVDAHWDAAREALRAPKAVACPPPGVQASLEDMLKQVDESFAQMLLRKIDERGLTDAACYKRANIDRRLFNKIKNNPGYRPGKQTVLAFAIALKLSLPETKEMLMKAGFALSRSSKADIVVEYCILHGHYDVIEINQVLFQLDLQPLGC